MALKDSGLNFDGRIKKREKYKMSKNSNLRTRMLSRLTSARFRFINESMYKSDESTSKELFTGDTSNFKAYHKGFRQQVKQWPINPLDIIIKSLQSRSDLKQLIVADFGCGEARLSAELSPFTKNIISYDLMAANPRVQVCDIRNTPLSKNSVDVVVLCLSLMAPSLVDHFKEVNRVLKKGGMIKIAEVESRFENVEKFIEDLKHFCFQLQTKDLTHNLFYFMDFQKVSDISKSKKRNLPNICLLPCVYKKR